ncbi:MAG: HEAT repeat domain-containing protein, partial [Blastocatellia bacterium]
QDPDSRVRAAAAEALRQHSSPISIGQLVTLMKSKDEGTRLATVEALGALSDAKSVAALAAALEDASEAVRAQAAEALGKLGDARGVKWLIASALSKRFAQESVPALQRVLEVATVSLDSETLQAVAHLDNVTQQFAFVAGDEAPQKSEIPIDCSEVRKLALEELMRRGEKA